MSDGPINPRLKEGLNRSWARVEEQLAERQHATDLRTIENYLDWQYAVHGMHETVEFHKQLLDEGREKPTIAEAREAMTRLREMTS